LVPCFVFNDSSEENGMKSNEQKPTRRNFLLGATLGTAATAAAIVAGKSNSELAAEVTAAAEPNADAPSGYHVTPRILHYYETTKL
jgi:hypothetical protein